MRRKQCSGFTLIELLIVVAIIAILAAIAVPNFLEAQTRSKISRVKGDMRSIELAVEAYRVDCNAYPYSSNTWYGLLLTTTPIAYMSTLPADPFIADASGYALTGFIFDPSYCFYHSKPTGYADPPGPDDRGLSVHLYAAMTRNLLVNRLVIKEGGSVRSENFGMAWEMRSPGPTRKYWYALPYDASNGTRSQGEIVLFGPGNLGLGF